MRVNLNDLQSEDLEIQTFEKFKNKKQKLKGKQSVNQLVLSEEDHFDPNSKFSNPDLNEFYRLGYLEDLVSNIKTGKEASVYLGKNSEGLIAVKVYTDLRVRSFRRDESYRQGRFIGDERLEKAIDQGSRKGLDAHQILWVQEEFRQMKYLYEFGVSVPKPVAVTGISIIMEFIGNEDGNPAPRLSDINLEKDEADEAFRQSVENLKMIVRSGRVHGDYSAFNILWHNEKAVVIDFPQVIEFHNNPNAKAFLERDVKSLCKSFKRLGVKVDETDILKYVLKMY